MARAGKRGRVFYSYLLSFLLILLVPVLMSVFVFRRANVVVTAESERASVALLETTGTYLDSLLQDVDQLSYLVAYSDRLEGMLYERAPVTGDEYFRAYELVQDFVDYRDSSTAVIDFYVYLPNLDMVISPNGYFTTRLYYLAMKDRDRDSYDSWISTFSASARRRFVTGRYARLPLSTESYVPAIELVLPLPLPQAGSNPRGFAVFQIDERPFRDQFGSTVWEDQSLFLVADETGDIISVSDRTFDVTSIVAPYREGLPVPPIAEIEIRGEPYVAFTRDSKAEGIDWTYAALIPGDLYANEFNRLRRFTLAALAVCAIVGGILIYLISSLRYRPIHDLLSMLRPDVDGTFTLRSDEFEIIRSSLSSTLAEDRLLRQEATENRDIVVQRLMQQLLKGSIVEGEEIDARLERMGVRVADLQRWLVGFEPDLMDRSLYPKIVATVEQTVSRWPERCMVVRDVDGIICLLFSGSFTGQETFLGPIRMMKRDLEAQFGISCPVGISGIHERGEGFAVLMKEVRAALSYRLVLGESQPVHVDQVLETSQTYHYPMEDENRLINSIVSGSYETAESILERVFEANFVRTRLSVEMARCLMFDLISTMIKALESISASDADAEFWSRTKPISRLTSCHSLEQLRSEMEVILRAVCDHVSAGRSSHTEHLRDEVVAIIEAGLRDRNLGPDVIADALGMNAAYVSRVFRDATGVGISQHIKALRVAEARRLLAEHELTVRQIADELGFVDSNALIRAFKSIEGVTPGEYRDTHQPEIAIPAPTNTDMRN